MTSYFGSNSSIHVRAPIQNCSSTSVSHFERSYYSDSCMCKDLSVSCSLSAVFERMWTQADSSKAFSLLHKSYTGSQTAFIWFPHDVRQRSECFSHFVVLKFQTWGHSVMLTTFTCSGSCWRPPVYHTEAFHFFHNVWMLLICNPVYLLRSCWSGWLLTLKWFLMLGDLWAPWVLGFTVTFEAQLEVCCTEV